MAPLDEVKMRSELELLLKEVDLKTTSIGAVRSSLEKRLGLEAGSLEPKKAWVLSVLKEMLHQQEVAAPTPAAKRKAPEKEVKEKKDKKDKKEKKEKKSKRRRLDDDGDEGADQSEEEAGAVAAEGEPVSNKAMEEELFGSPQEGLEDELFGSPEGED
mmetsp:Transcript_28610/g.62425  ORF Transcript_28610/g.62425 Transcript_28610/m.62425 type:complete len:158 (+) Transcript_28610:57-530(+)